MTRLNDNLLAEVANAINRLVMVKAIEIKAAGIRETGNYETSSYGKAEDFMRDTSNCNASLEDIADDAEGAIVQIASATDTTSSSIVGAVHEGLGLDSEFLDECAQCENYRGDH